MLSLNFNFKKFIIVCGHYGCGKTNFCINLAFDLSRLGKKVSIVDIDIVNPYFRASEYKDILSAKNINIISPAYALSTLDIPALSSEIYSIFSNDDDHVIIDTGGDDAGVTALGRFSSNIIESKNYTMLYLVNSYRALTKTTSEAVTIFHEIEAASKLKVTGIVNNSHLKAKTSAKDIINSCEFADNVAFELNLPVIITTAPANIYNELVDKINNLYKVNIHVKSSWE
jgi:CobQ/CobB/MinD/ParA nucleotide binding domain.